MDLLVGTGVTTALENVQWPKPFLKPAKPLEIGTGRGAVPECLSGVVVSKHFSLICNL